MFCEESSLSTSLGLYDSCLVLIIVSIGFLWIIINTIRYILLYKTPNIDVKIERSENHLSTFLANKSIYHYNRKKLYTFIINLIFNSIQTISSIIILIYSYLYTIEGCDQLSASLILCIRIIGYITIIYYIHIYIYHALDSKLKFVVLYNCLGWNILQVISGGLNSIQYFNNNIVVSIMSIVYFVNSVIISIYWIYQLFLIRTNHNQINNQLFTQQQSIVSTTSSLVTPETINKLIEDNDIEALVDIRLSESSNESERSNSIYSNISISNHSNFKSNTKPYKSMRDSILSNCLTDVTISVIEWDRIFINNKSIVIYKLGLGEYINRLSESTNAPRSVRIIMKRFDELLYLREKIISDFPYITDLPNVPSISDVTKLDETLVKSFQTVNIDNTANSNRTKEYEKHRLEMNNYLELLITHPVANRLAIHNLRGNTTNTSRKSNTEPSADVPSNQYINSVSNIYPLIHPNDNISVNVIGRSDAIINESTNSSRNNIVKTFYEIEIDNKDNNWTIRKRFRQIRALYKILDLRGFNKQHKIEYPTKHSQRKSLNIRNSVNRLEEGKLNENTLSIEGFVRSCMNCFQNNLPDEFIIFLETDIYKIRQWIDVSPNHAIRLSNSLPTYVPNTNNSTIDNDENKDYEYKITSGDDYLSNHSKLYKLLHHITTTIKTSNPANNCMLALNQLDMQILHPMNNINNELPIQSNNQLTSRSSDYSNNIPDDLTANVIDHNDEYIYTEEMSYNFDNSYQSIDVIQSITNNINSSFNSTSNITASPASNKSNSQKSKNRLVRAKQKIRYIRDSILKSITLSNPLNLTFQQLLLLPNVLLYDLINLYKYIYSIVYPTTASTNSSDSLPYEYQCIADNNIKPSVDDNNTIIYLSNWISQHRLRELIVTSTAFSYIISYTTLLQYVNLKEFKAISNEHKLCFLINCYNLMSLHAAMLLPWPLITDNSGRAHWQNHVRYKIGSSCLSLLQIEHAILRAGSSSWEIPSMPGAPDVLVPTAADVKLHTNMLCNFTEPRIVTALSLPYSTSNSIYLYNSQDIKSELKVNTTKKLTSYLIQNNSMIYLPKYMKQHINDYRMWTDSDANDINDIEDEFDHPIDFESESKAYQSNDWDKASYSNKHIISSISNKQTQSASFNSNNLEAISFDRYTSTGDIDISELQLNKLTRILRLGVDIQDRRRTIRTYKQCFIGSEAVKCLVASGDAKTNNEAKVLINILIEYGYIRNVSYDNWYKDNEFYQFTDLTTSQPIISPYYKFMLGNTDRRDLKQQIQLAFDNNADVCYSHEDYSFKLLL